jgi:hypothetical protein
MERWQMAEVHLSAIRQTCGHGRKAREPPGIIHWYTLRDSRFRRRDRLTRSKRRRYDPPPVTLRALEQPPTDTPNWSFQ